MLGSRAKTYWTKRLELSMFEKLRLNMTELCGKPGYANQVGGIKIGEWARRKQDYEKSCKDHKKAYGRSVDDPPVHYQLAIATLQTGGNQRKIAFSDGSTLGAHPLNAVIQQSFRDSLPPCRVKYCDDRKASDTSRALVNLVGVISHDTDATSLRTLATSHGLAQDDTLLWAIHVASMWGIIFTEGNTSVVQLCQMARDPGILMSELLDSVTLHLTDAGHVWHECSDEAQTAREQDQRRIRMSQSGSPKIVINNPVGNINVAGRNLYGQTSNFHGGKPSSEEVLQALEVILKQPDIHWKSADLAGVHATIQEAVHKRDTTHAGLRPAVAKLVRVCERLSLGIVGDTLFEALKGFVN